MRVWSVIAFVMTALGSTGVCAQTMGEVPGQAGMPGAYAPPPAPRSPKAARKAACERDALLTYRIGRNLSEDWQRQVKATRKAYVQDCMSKAGFAP